MGKRQQAREPWRPVPVEVIGERHRRPGDPAASTSVEPRYEAPGQPIPSDAAGHSPATRDRAGEDQETASTVACLPGSGEGADAALPSRKRKRAPVIEDAELEIVEVEASPEEAHLMWDAVQIIARMMIRRYQETRTTRADQSLDSCLPEDPPVPIGT